VTIDLSTGEIFTLAKEVIRSKVAAETRLKRREEEPLMVVAK